MSDCYGDDFDIPLEQKKPFGAGIKRKRIEFVKAADSELQTTALPPTKSAADSGSSVADLYLSLVLPDETEKWKKKKEGQTEAEAGRTICAVCNLPLEADAENTEQTPPHTGGESRYEQIPEIQGQRPDKPEPNGTKTTRQRHETSIAHQVCLTHSHPPSALDRKRMGLAYLSSHGWDPDSRRGLGVEEQGIQYPLKSRPKDDNFGLGLEVPKDVQERIEARKREKQEKEKEKRKNKPVDKRKAKARAEEERRKADRLREMFYGSEDLQRHLGKS